MYNAPRLEMGLRRALMATLSRFATAADEVLEIVHVIADEPVPPVVPRARSGGPPGLERPGRAAKILRRGDRCEPR